jgi:hypothetical protein
VAYGPQKKAYLGTKDQHGSKQAARRARCIRYRTKRETENEDEDEPNHEDSLSSEHPLGDCIPAAHQTGRKPCQQPYYGSNGRSTEIRRMPPEVIRRPKRAQDGSVVSDANKASGYAQGKVDRECRKPWVKYWCDLEVGSLTEKKTGCSDRAR